MPIVNSYFHDYFIYIYFFWQVAGATAAAGLSLTEVAAAAKHAAELVGTMGVALSVCTLPGQPTSDRLGTEKMELGLGIVSLYLYLKVK